MKTAIDKNETEVQKMKREVLEWIERHGKTAPPFLTIAVNSFPESEPQKAGMPTDKQIEIIVDTFRDKWEQESNPFYPSSMRWDRYSLNAMLRDLFTSRLSVPEVKPISDSDMQTYFKDIISDRMILAMDESEAIAMVRHFLPETGAKPSDVKVSDEDPKEINPYEVQKDLFPKKERPDPKDVNPYQTQRIKP